MALGNFDRLINIEKFTRIIGGYGEGSKSWSSLYTNVWAELTYQSGAEGVENDQIVATNEVFFRIRYLSSIDESCRIIYGGEYYNISWIQVEGRNKYLKFKAEKADNNQWS